MKLKLFILFFMCGTIIFAQNFNYPKTDKNDSVYFNSEFHGVVSFSPDMKFKKHPKNIILLIGDGMGLTEAYAGYTANQGKLNIFNMPVTGFSKTESADNYTTDSAAGGTALSAGKRTNNGVIGMDTSLTAIETILEIGEKNGKATGLVSTSSIVHATPASFIAHQTSRNMYEEIATDFLKTDIEVFIGGGKKYFDTRKDEKNLLDDLKAKGYEVADNLEAIEASSADKLAGFFAEGHGSAMPERGEVLSIGTKKALEILSKNKDGFFLMVEGSQIDWGGHANQTEYVIRETLDFDKTVGIALEYALKDKNTLVIVTADHETGGMAINDASAKEGLVNGIFTSTNHTPIMVPVYAFGPYADQFTGVYKNTDIFYKMLNAWKLKPAKK